MLMTPIASQERGEEVREGGKTCSQDRKGRREHQRWREESQGREGEEAGRDCIRKHNSAWREER